ncbi:hypothetical protein AcV7_010416 [Taiwanofungus camphoratus]|nr:hypothetical protein AcV7_010416 [Antrodia cinnamomea]
MPSAYSELANWDGSLSHPSPPPDPPHRLPRAHPDADTDADDDADVASVASMLFLPSDEDDDLPHRPAPKREDRPLATSKPNESVPATVLVATCSPALGSQPKHEHGRGSQPEATPPPHPPSSHSKLLQTRPSRTAHIFTADTGPAHMFTAEIQSPSLSLSPSPPRPKSKSNHALTIQIFADEVNEFPSPPPPSPQPSARPRPRPKPRPKLKPKSTELEFAAAAASPHRSTSHSNPNPNPNAHSSQSERQRLAEQIFAVDLAPARARAQLHPGPAKGMGKGKGREGTVADAEADIDTDALSGAAQDTAISADAQHPCPRTPSPLASLFSDADTDADSCPSPLSASPPTSKMPPRLPKRLPLQPPPPPPPPPPSRTPRHRAYVAVPPLPRKRVRRAGDRGDGGGRLEFAARPETHKRTSAPSTTDMSNVLDAVFRANARAGTWAPAGPVISTGPAAPAAVFRMTGKRRRAPDSTSHPPARRKRARLDTPSGAGSSRRRDHREVGNGKQKEEEEVRGKEKGKGSGKEKAEEKAEEKEEEKGKEKADVKEEETVSPLTAPDPFEPLLPARAVSVELEWPVLTPHALCTALRHEQPDVAFWCAYAWAGTGVVGHKARVDDRDSEGARAMGCLALEVGVQTDTDADAEGETVSLSPATPEITPDSLGPTASTSTSTQDASPPASPLALLPAPAHAYYHPHAPLSPPFAPPPPPHDYGRFAHYDAQGKLLPHPALANPWISASMGPGEPDLHFPGAGVQGYRQGHGSALSPAPAQDVLPLRASPHGEHGSPFHTDAVIDLQLLAQSVGHAGHQDHETRAEHEHEHAQPVRMQSVHSSDMDADGDTDPGFFDFAACADVDTEAVVEVGACMGGGDALADGTVFGGAGGVGAEDGAGVSFVSNGTIDPSLLGGPPVLAPEPEPSPPPESKRLDGKSKMGGRGKVLWMRGGKRVSGPHAVRPLSPEVEEKTREAEHDVNTEEAEEEDNDDDGDDEDEYRPSPKPKSKSQSKPTTREKPKTQERASFPASTERVSRLRPSVSASVGLSMSAEPESLNRKRKRKPTARALASRVAPSSSTLAASTSYSHDNDMDEDEDTVVTKTGPRRAQSKSVVELAAAATFCHHCRRTSAHEKMRCTVIKEGGVPCGMRYCVVCVFKRYPEITFDAYARTFVCPRCRNTCNCTVCSRKRGEVYIPASRTRIKLDFNLTPGLPLPAQRSFSSAPKAKARRAERPASVAPVSRRKGKEKATDAAPSLSPVLTLAGYEPQKSDVYFGAVYGIYGERVGAGFVGDNSGAIVVQPVTDAPVPSGPGRRRKREFIGAPRPSWPARTCAADGDREDVLPGTRAYIGDKKALDPDSGYLPVASLQVHSRSSTLTPLLSPEAQLNSWGGGQEQGVHLDRNAEVLGIDEGGSDPWSGMGDPNNDLPFIIAQALAAVSVDG